ncbi:rho GTPase-activating protein 11A-like isoform X1 [Diabrotica undecimpunctata]|uniref:rho GTPase-activating protein 11A-like isoform X1 n=1 Tax=Diabrotica undecimpunctata TaxID=50387 RepID=UPI003B632F14
MTNECSKICTCIHFFGSYPHKDIVRENVVKYYARLGVQYEPPEEIKAQPRNNKKAQNNEKLQPTKWALCRRKPIVEDYLSPLESLKMRTVKLKTNQIVEVPEYLHNMCSFILKHAVTKGIFKKRGNNTKQEAVLQMIMHDQCLPLDIYSPIDIAMAILKYLKKLPTPLIPSTYHELFFSCYELYEREEALLLACLLLPIVHINALAYTLQFFDEITKQKSSNQLDLDTLVNSVGPLIMPSTNKKSVANSIVKILISRSDMIGMVPEVMTAKWPLRRNKTICQKLTAIFETFEDVLRRIKV